MHRQAGASEVLIVSENRFALMHELRGAPEPTLPELIARLSPVDLVIVEGFKRGPHPKIEIWREANGRPFLHPEDPTIRAIAADRPLPDAPIPVIDLDDIGMIANVILAEARPGRGGVRDGVLSEPAHHTSMVGRDGAATGPIIRRSFRSRIAMKPLAALPLIAALALCQPASAAPWENANPAQAGWSTSGLDAARQHSEKLGSTAIMIVQDGKVIARWGDVERKVNAASVRKSFLGALYGIAVSEGKINLTSTLGDLGVDDISPSLTPEEKQATVRDLLMARSGVYHRAAHETAVIRRHRPERGSHAPGTFFFYNNWDFNALGSIYRKQTGEDIFQSFATRIAQPIGMEDFVLSDCRYVFEKVSEHPAYTFRMSARDLARFRQLILDGGQWDGRQLVPADWIKQSTTSYSQSERKGIGYGYLWWTLDPARWGEAASLASGFGGQLIAVLPAKKMVVVQTVDRSENRDGIRTSRFLGLLKDIVAAAP